MDANEVWAISAALLALALLMFGGVIASRVFAQMRSGRTVSRALGERATAVASGAAAAAHASASAVASPGLAGARGRDAAGNAARGGASGGTNSAGATGKAGTQGEGGANGANGHAASSGHAASPGRAGAGGVAYLLDRIAAIGLHWFDSQLGQQLVAAEDRQLIDQCGFIDTRARGIFLAARVAGAIGLPLLASFVLGGHSTGGPVRYGVMLFFALGIGYMAPKWVLGRIAANRRQAVTNELPMLIDLLRLLQGVGLSIDQCVQVIVGEFRRVLPVLGQELEIANRHFVTGRTREQSLQRLANTYDNDDLRAVVRLIVQVDKHGGAVQEPLKQFGERLREGRRTSMRERIGKLTVKMTTVMITTLLPALLIVTAGPGFLAVMRSLSVLAGRH
jgi:tight adherence protein C